MKAAIITTVIVLILLLLAKGKLFDLSPEKDSQPNTKKMQVVKKTPTPTPQPSTQTINGWKQIMVDDGFTWFEPGDPSKTTEWFDISRWNILDRLKKPAIMEFKTSSGELIAFRVDETGKYLKQPDGSFSNQKWLEDEYLKVFHRSTDIRYHPLPGSTLDLWVARRSY